MWRSHLQISMGEPGENKSIMPERPGCQWNPCEDSGNHRQKRGIQKCRYIINCVRVGGLEGFETDIEIPLKYGVDQCVGDTLCTGGIMYGQRVIAAMLDFCKDIREVAEEGAIMLNYSNPMQWQPGPAINTAA